MEIVSIFAILISPVVAVLVTLYIQGKKTVRQDKLAVLSTLMATRTDRLQAEHVRALNMIDFTFHDDAVVRKAWRDYHDMLANSGLNDENGWIQRDRKYRELLDTMAKALNYNVTLADIERTYTPMVFGTRQANDDELRNEVMRLLKASHCLGLPMENTIFEGGGAK